MNKTPNRGAEPAQALHADKVWSSCQAQLRTLLNPETFSLWFAPVQACAIDEKAITLGVSNEFCEVWLKDNYLGLLQDAVAHATGRTLLVKFKVLGAGSLAATGSGAATQAKSKASASNSPVHEGVPARGSANADATFNPRNTFETFVVGSNNNFAHAAALAVAQQPAKSYNPLFVYGGVGLGKTHLLHAIGQYVHAHKKGAKVAYVSSERFTNEYIDALQNNQFARFRKKYRSADVLLIDDIQFLAGKERIQEEFFHTFNAVMEARHQLVLSCDRAPSEIQGLEQRLVSRFEWGLVADVQAPDFEMRLAILQKKARLLNVEVAPEVIDFLAHRIRSNIRRLEGALIRVTSFTTLTGRKVTVEQTETMLREILHEESRAVVNIDTIQKIVATEYDIRLADMTSKRRPENIAFPRQVAMFLSRHLTESSLSAIGEAFGGRDHGTVLHACRLVKDRMEVDPAIRQRVGMLEKKLQR